MTPRPKPSRTARLAAKRARREAEILRRGELRHDVIVRAAGRCEWCGTRVPPGELHHILSGSRRRHEERLSTLAFVCVACHHGYHASVDLVLWKAAAWANFHRFSEAEDEVARRIRKVAAAQRARLRESA